MARFTFTKNFDYRPAPGVVIAFKAGHTYPNVRRECVDQAIGANAGREDKAPRRRSASA